jgi:microcystin-dependent protein
MDEPFLGEIRLMSFAFAPDGWVPCNGQILPINQNQALFSLLGTNYGGDGRVNFALPDLRGRVPGHASTDHVLGQRLGEEAHTLTVGELPRHTHAVPAVDVDGTQATPAGGALARAGDLYGTPSDLVALQGGSTSGVGGSQAHPNMQPYLTLSYCIATFGVFPSQA